MTFIIFSRKNTGEFVHYIVWSKIHVEKACTQARTHAHTHTDTFTCRRCLPLHPESPRLVHNHCKCLHTKFSKLHGTLDFVRSLSKVQIKMDAKCEDLEFFSFIVPSNLAALMTAFAFLYKLTSESTYEVTICECKFRVVAPTDSTDVTGNTLLFLILA